MREASTSPRLSDDFKELSRLLNANRVDYLLVGGYAVGLHGYPSATVDLAGRRKDLADLENLP